MIERKLIYMDAKSSKFWTILQDGNAHTVTYGRIGSAGQKSSKVFESEAAAAKDAEKLIKEKLTKGYVDEAIPSDQGGPIPLAAFPNIHHQDDIYSNAGTFIGKRVLDYDAEKPARSDVAYRFRSDWDGKEIIPDLLHFLQTSAAQECSALVIGFWGGEDTSTPPDSVFQTLIEQHAKLPRLGALFLGDIMGEESEISWIRQSNLSPILEAFPALQLLRSRGGEGLEFRPLRQEGLRGLAMEAGGLPAEAVRGVLKSDFPNLEYLELWLGTSDYGGTTSIADLEPLLSGSLFPKLKYLGLRNSEIANEIAQAVAQCPLLERIETLDLSLGTLSDEGAESLLRLKSGSLKRLNLHYNFMSPEMTRKVKALPFIVDASNPPNMETDEEDRYVAVGE